MNRGHLFGFVWLLLATACFIRPASADDNVPDSLTSIEQDLDQNNSRVSKETTSDFSKRALAAANFALATQLENNSQFSDALDKYYLVTQADSGYIPAYTHIAVIYIKQEKYQQAATFLTEKETSFPDSAEIKSILAYLAYKQGNREQAVSYTLKSLQLNPELVSNYSLLARCYLDQNQSAEIAPLMAKSLAVNSPKSSYYSRLGDFWTQILYQINPLTDKEIATQTLPFYEKAAALSPGNTQLAFRLGQLQFELEDYPKALGYYEQTYQKSPRTLGLRERMSICYLTLKKTDQAIGVLESLLEDYPERKNLYPMIAELYGHDGQWDKAVNYYRLYVQLSNPDAQDFVNLANAQIQARHPNDALDTLTQAEKVYPDIPNLQLFQALVLRNLERWKDALAIFQNLEQQNGKLIDSNFYFDYAVTYEKSGDEAKAVELFRKCLNLNPNNHQALNYLGYMWASKGENLDEAEQMIAKALTLDPDSSAYLDSMAWVYYQKKQYDKALEFQQKAIVGMPDDPEVLEHLADIYYKLGNSEKAIEAWSKASLKAKDPESLKAKIQSAREQLQASLQP
ncbi:MAG: tetratricopeptide repeat protein [Verrucomicrobiales bacterium]|nr:tetratricopeptide repeat protein [Verrucomicrobiales bacterium]